MSSASDSPTLEAPAAVDIDEVVGGFGDLPTVAPIAMRVIEMVDDEDVTINQLADVISTDPGLASRLLRLANSAAYSRGQPVTALARAAMLLGLRTLKMVTLGFSLMDRPGARSATGNLIWRRSLASAVFGRRLALTVAPEMSEDAFTAGLLSNVGKTALLDVPAYLETIDRRGPWISPQVEVESFGFTSDALTARILDGWELPGLLTEAIWSRHPESDDEVPDQLGSILRLADNAAVLILGTDPDDMARAFDSSRLAAAHLGMTMDEIERVVAMTGPELDELSGSFDLEAIDLGSVDDLVRAAQSRLASVALDVASQLGEVKNRNDELVETNQELAAAASTDALTGLPNRRTFDAFLNNQVASRQRHPRESALGLIVMDIDKFKVVNDTYGHAVGDEVLIEAGKRLADGSRRGELIARTGGEEFALILPEIAIDDLEGAGERLRKIMADSPVDTSAGPLPITISVGGSWTTEPPDGAEKSLYEAADAALYASKDGGRNQVTVQSMD